MTAEVQRFHGAYPVLVTPFAEDGSIDFGVYREMLEWYLARRVGGFYAHCASSEMFHLNDDERVALVRETVRTVRGRVPIAATGNFGPDLASQIDLCRRIHDAGPDAVVIRVPDFETTDAELAAYYEAFADALDFPLGIYECPGPVRRLLPAALTRKLALTGRFRVFKETSSNLETARAQIRATQDTPLAYFQANTPYLPDSVRWGAAGAMSIAADVAPELVAEVIESANTDPARCERAHAFLCEFDLLTRLGHPVSTKRILAWRGVPIHPRTRTGRVLSPETERALERVAHRLLSDAPALRHE